MTASAGPVRVALIVGTSAGGPGAMLARRLLDRRDVLLTIVGTRASLDDVLATTAGRLPSREIVIPFTGDAAVALWIRYVLGHVLERRRVDVIHATTGVAPVHPGSAVVVWADSTVLDGPRTEGAASDTTCNAGAGVGSGSIDHLIASYRTMLDLRRLGPRQEGAAPQSASPRVAIVNDWLLNLGGGERVTRVLRDMFPDAPVYTSQFDADGFDWFDGVDVRTTWLQRLPSGLKKFLPPLRALAFRQLDLSRYDIVLTSSSAESKSVRARSDALQVTYCHSPSHYYWSRYDEYLRSPGLGRLDPLGRLGLRTLIGPMRAADFRGAQHADVVLVNSAHIQSEVARIYRRDSRVVHPPVDTRRIARRTAVPQARSGYVIAGRQTHYKRFDLAVAACTALGRELLVMGDGPEHDRLRALAGPTISFQRSVDDDQWVDLLARAEAFLFPGVDDFGITPVEAMAAGTPVIAYRAGGAIEYVEPGATGVFFETQSSESLAEAIREFETLEFDREKVRAAAERFSTARFRLEIQDVVTEYFGTPVEAVVHD